MPEGPESNFLSHGILLCYFQILILEFWNIVNAAGRVSEFGKVAFGSKWVIPRTSGKLGKCSLAQATSI